MEEEVTAETPLSKLMRTWEYDADVEGEYDPELGYPQPQNWIQIAVREWDKVEWRIKDLVPVAGITILAGVSGEGKTWFGMYAAKCISERVTFLDRFETAQGRVLYINAEMSESEVQRRGKLLGIRDDNTNLLILNRDDFNINAPYNSEDTKDFKWLLKYVYQQKIDVVVLDTLRAVAGGLREEKAEEVRTLFKKLSILKNSNVSVIVLDHFRKTSTFESKTPSKQSLIGSVDKVNNAEVLLMLKNEGNGQIQLYQTKNRLGKELDPFLIRMEDFTRDNGEPGVRFVFMGKFDDRESKKEEAKEMIITLLENGGKTRTEIIAIFRDRKIGEKNVSDALREMEKEKLIDSVQQGHRKFYFLMSKSDDSSSEGTIVANEVE